MKKHHNDYLAEGISALLPVYTDGVGDITLLINLKGEERMIHKKLKTVVKRLASYFSYDIVALRKKYGDVISQKHKIPLPLHPDLILIPFKIRHPMIKGDNTYGYVNYRCIDKHIKDNNHSKLILNNGLEIPLLQSYYTTQRNILNAIVVTKEFAEQHYGTSEIADNLKNLKEGLDSPATRGDIAILNHHISRLLQLIEYIVKK